MERREGKGQGEGGGRRWEGEGRGDTVNPFYARYEVITYLKPVRVCTGF